MSESSSIIAESTLTADTADSGYSRSDASGTSVPLVLASAYQEKLLQQKQQALLPHLPSHRYRYSVWHDLNKTHVKGDELHAPRIRDGPPEKEDMFYHIRDKDTNNLIHHSRQGKERKDYRDTRENWENATFANLSYQDLQHKYQLDNFIRVLKRLFRVEQLNLQENRLVNVSSVTFPRCTHLNLSRNFIGHFKHLPKMPMIQHLNLYGNNIKTTDGIQVLSKTPIESLNLRGNDVAFTLNYRQKVFAALPQLKLLDDVPFRPEDEDYAPEDDPQGSSSCVIS